MLIWTTIAVVSGCVVASQVLHLAVVLQWSDRATLGSRYYRRPQASRQRYRRLVRLHALLLQPILALLARLSRPRFAERCIRFAGVAGPAGACSAESFRRAAEYSPRSEDVFVVTQMRSGTTWMQHLVYQVLTRGQGDLVASGTALNAVSPWIESVRTVSVGEAPTVGVERPARIIKTHLPLELCPLSRNAKYVYVARHPLSCFASCADYVRGNLGLFAPDWDELARWFMSDELMWWGDWVNHVGQWQQEASRDDNVLLVRYEDLLEDLPAQAQRLAAFLGLNPLTADEMASVARKCRLAYMRAHAEQFEMHPPHLLQAANAFFVSGTLQRAKSVPPAIAEQILQWCRATCLSRGMALEQLYGDLAVAPDESLCGGRSGR